MPAVVTIDTERCQGDLATHAQRGRRHSERGVPCQHVTGEGSDLDEASTQMRRSR
jgi:hypothetical protein